MVLNRIFGNRVEEDETVGLKINTEEEQEKMGKHQRAAEDLYLDPAGNCVDRIEGQPAVLLARKGRKVSEAQIAAHHVPKSKLSDGKAVEQSEDKSVKKGSDK